MGGWQTTAADGRRSTAGEALAGIGALASALGFIYVPYWAALLGGGISARQLLGRSKIRRDAMQGDESFTWQGDVVHSSEPQPYAATLRHNRQTGTLTVTIGNTDLPAFVSDGQLHIQAPLPLLFEAFAESLPDFVRDMEIRVSVAGRATLSLDRNGRPVSGATVAKSRVVRRGRQS